MVGRGRFRVNWSLRPWSFAAFIRLSMAREERKRVELRPVDDEVTPVKDVVRLENRETGHKPKDEEPVRLGPSDAGRAPSRLDVPSRDEVELRTYQPDIDVLIDSAAAAAEPVEESWGGNSSIRNPIPWGWFALIGLVIAGALTWSATHWEKAEEQAVQIREITETVLVDEEREEREALELVERIEAALKSFYTTESLDSLARQVRHPERVLPLMRKHHALDPLRMNPIKSFSALQPVTLDNRANFWVASVVLSDGGKPNLIIEIDPAGNPLIDWETLVCDQPMPWDEFARERPAGKSMDFRVYVERDAFFSHEFADSGRWLCFRLTAPGGEDSMFGYVLAESDEARKLLEVIQKNGSGRTSLILRLGIPERLQSRHGVVIEKTLSSRWIYIDPPQDSP
jgi:hypothetical protein